MTTHRHRFLDSSNILLALLALTALPLPLAAAQVVRPDPAEVLAIERANESLSPGQALKKLDTRAGAWRVEQQSLLQSDRSEMYARTFIKGPRWVDCIVKVKLRVDAIGPSGASNGIRLILRADEKTDTFYTVGLWAGSREVRIEKSRRLAFEQMTCNQVGTLASASFPVELGKTYEMTVVADHATIYCYIDGKFVVLAQEPDFTTQPAGRVGFFTSNAVGAFSDVSIKALPYVTSSPVTPYAGNPLNVPTYAPAVVKDDKYRMWDGMGRYAESPDGITWTRPEGAAPVVNRGNLSDWPTGNQCGDPDVLKLDGQYWITFWSTCNRRNGAFDGMGIKRSTDGIHWKPEPANPVFYMGPYGDWDEMVVGDHALIKDGDLFKLWHVGITRWQRGYRNEFGYAESPDGIHWRKCRLNPVLTQGNPGTWDGGWIYAAGVVKLDDEQLDTHIYAGKPGASYHLFYTGQPTNNEIICGVKRVGYAFSLDGIHWVKWNDPKTTEPPFQDSDPVLSWAEYGRKGFIGVGASTAMRVGDEVRIYHSMYDERLDIPRIDGVVGTGFATVKVDSLRKIVADAKAQGLLPCATRQEVQATLDAPLPQSMWDDWQGHILLAVQARQSGNADAEKSALADVAATHAKFTKALQRYYESTFAPLKRVVDQLQSGHPITEKLLWSLPEPRMESKTPEIAFTGLNLAAGNHPVMIEIEAKCDRFDIARLAWSTDDAFQSAGEIEFTMGYPSPRTPTYRLTIATDGQPIRALRLRLPAGSTIDLQQLRAREFAF